MVRKSASFHEENVLEHHNNALKRTFRKLSERIPRSRQKFGVRVSSEDSWVLVRESGTEPVMRITTESKQRSQGESNHEGDPQASQTGPEGERVVEGRRLGRRPRRETLAVNGGTIPNLSFHSPTSLC